MLKSQGERLYSVESDEGYAAYEAGKDIESNPYCNGGSAWTNWVDGWLCAAFDYEGPPF
jgi:hypothetical protein